jgi:hypothetical protein
MNDPILLLPIHLDGLLVGEELPSREQFQWTELNPNFSKLVKGYFFGHELVSNGDPFNESGGLASGIHMHFRLPRFFSKGIQEGSGNALFPSIPNRWLVQRYNDNGGKNSKLNFKAWLIRSDGESPDGITWPIFDMNGKIEFVKLGICNEISAPPAFHDGPARMKITAAGAADPAFSVFYPACRNILGFYDPLTDITVGSRLSYLVTGWYSDPVDDPIFEFIEKYRTKSEIKTPQEPQKTDEIQKTLSEALCEWVEAQGWSVDGLKECDSLPGGILCHGLIKGIIWQGRDKNYMQPSGQGLDLNCPSIFPLTQQEINESYRVGIGTTPSEAIAALLVPGELNQDLLTALQNNVVSQPNTISELQYELHERGFASVYGGTSFHLRQESNQSNINIPDTSQKPAGEPPLPADLREFLNKLNDAQQQYDDLSRILKDWSWQVYSLWYLWTDKNREFRSMGNKEARSMANYLKYQFDNARIQLTNAESKWNLVKGRLREVAEQIKNCIAKYPEETSGNTAGPVNEIAGRNKYRLSSLSAASFHKPHDPGIALQGPAMDYLNSEPTVEKLKCRISGMEVTEISLQISAGKLATITGEQLITRLFANQSSLLPSSGIHRKLLAESLLLDDWFLSDISGSISNLYKNEISKILKELQNSDLTPEQERNLIPNRLTGVRPDQTAMFTWSANPWIPLFIAWDIEWYSDYPEGHSLPQDIITRAWHLGVNAGSGHDCDLIPNDIKQPAPEQTWQYNGYSILTPSTGNNLVKQLELLDIFHPLIDFIQKAKMRTLILDGFNDALIRQRSGLQLPPLDYKTWYDSRGNIHAISSVHNVIDDSFHAEPNIFSHENQKIGDPVIDLIEDALIRGNMQQREFRTTPRGSDVPFLPIRSGRLKINHLSVIDAFGQTLKLPVDAINKTARSDWKARMLRSSHSCTTDTFLSADPASISLRPRFVKPVRLRFQWEKASDYSDKTPNPVCGWILPNHLDKNLLVYSADGKLLGALQKKLGLKSGSNSRAFYWSDAPGENTETSLTFNRNNTKHLQDIITDIHLRYFCQWVLNLIPDEGNTFSAILDRAITFSNQRVPEEDRSVSILIGRPLALTRASLQLEPAGLHAHQPDLPEGSGTTEHLETRNIQYVKLPLRLGDLHARNDGLIGAFRCFPSSDNNTSETNGPFYPVWGEDKSIQRESIPVFSIQDFEIDAVQPLHITLLMDPQARVHATTGVLPRSYIELPHENVTGARRVREVFFQTAPVLGISTKPLIPKPSDDYGEWSWAYRPDVTGWKLDPAIVEATHRAAFTETCPSISEGWLKLAIAPVKVLSFWVRGPVEGVESVARGTRISLAWCLQGADSLLLEQLLNDGSPLLLAKWDAPPFPREFQLIIQSASCFRLSAFAEDAQPSTKLLNVKLTN